MKIRSILILAVAVVVTVAACKKEEGSERFRLLTGTIWQSDDLLVDGQDASGAGQPLEIFVGEAEFKKDGTGTFGQFEGTWYFSNNENNITITTTELPVPLTTSIEELTKQSFKITTLFPILGDPSAPNLIRITFKAKP
jgi:hypothetical protein